MTRKITALVAAFLLTTGATTAAQASESSTVDIRVLNWNIYLGGTGAGDGNVPLMLDQVVDVAPDVFFAVETYGSGPQILAALNERAGKGTYHAVQITPGNGVYQDNLWVFTRFPVVQVYPKPVSKEISAFNFGGVRVRLPNGREINLFDTWLSYNEPWVGDMIEANADQISAGKEPTYRPRQVQKSESNGLADARAALAALPGMLGGNADPIIMAGDFNTVPATDWTAAWAGCPSHTGQRYDLRLTDEVTGSGFTDAYRATNPDACTSAGPTWSPHYDYDVPMRIDFTFVKGTAITPLRSHTVTTRLPGHPAGDFYSDHAAVVADLRIG